VRQNNFPARFSLYHFLVDFPRAQLDTHPRVADLHTWMVLRQILVSWPKSNYALGKIGVREPGKVR